MYPTAAPLLGYRPPSRTELQNSNLAETHQSLAADRACEGVKSESLDRDDAGYTAYCGARVYKAQKGDSKDAEQLSPVPVLIKAGLSLETQWAFMQLGLSGGFMMAAEASSFDVTTALAGLLGAPVATCDAHSRHPERAKLWDSTCLSAQPSPPTVLSLPQSTVPPL